MTELADGDTPKHVRDTTARVRRILDGCGFVFIRDLSASAAQTFLASLRTQGRQRVELSADQEWFTKAELVEILGVHPKGVSALFRRHELSGTGNGKARRAGGRRGAARLPCRGAGTATVNAYLRACKSFVAWLVADRLTSENPRRGRAPGLIRPEDRDFLEPWGSTWYVWVAATFLKTYLSHTKQATFLPSTRDELQALFDAFLLEKSLHELGHELKYRPHWVSIPLLALLQLLGAPA